MNCLVLLCGCGHQDGSEIRESVLTMLELERLEIDFVCCAPNITQEYVTDHVSGQVSYDQKERNILIESARISRGNIIDIKKVDVGKFDMLLFPGGLGVAKSISNVISSEEKVHVQADIANIISKFHSQQKAIGAICISPAVVAAVLSKNNIEAKVTLGDKANSAIVTRCGGIHVPCPTDDYVVDEVNAVYSCPAYMRNDKLHIIHLGIQKMINAMYVFTKESKAKNI